MLKIIKDMPLKDKIDYIWTYYKIHIFAIIFFIFLFLWIINTYFLNPAKKEYISIAFLNNLVTNESVESLKNQLNLSLIDENENATCVINNFYNSSDIELNSANQMKFMALIATNSLDIIIDEESSFLSNETVEMYADLNDYFTEEELLMFSNKFFENEFRQKVGLHIQHSKIFDGLGINYDNKVVSIINGSNKEETRKTFNFLFNK